MTQNKKVIAITGGIGSGKSEVSKIIFELGYPVFSCDKIYAELLNSGIFNDVYLQNFGNVFNADGSLNKANLAKIVFSDEKQLKLLNSLTHKIILSEVFKRVNVESKTCFVEVPLLFESNTQSQFDEVIVVKRKLQNRINSVIQRDNLSEKEVKMRILKQFDYNKANLSQYYEVNNDGTIEELKDAVSKLLKKILIE